MRHESKGMETSMGKESLLSESDFYLRIAGGCVSPNIWDGAITFCLVSRKNNTPFFSFFFSLDDNMNGGMCTATSS